MGRPSTIDQLPENMRATLGKLRQFGWTIDQVHEHMLELYDRSPSRSALGRHFKGMEKIGERMRNARIMAEALGRQIGDSKVSEVTSLNIELLQGIVLELFMKHADGDADSIDDAGKAALAGDPEGLQFLAKTLDHLGRATKTNLDVVVAAEKRAADRAKAEAMQVVETVAKSGGITAQTMNAIKAGIFGVKALPPPAPA